MHEGSITHISKDLARPVTRIVGSYDPEKCKFGLEKGVEILIEF